jgi:DNA repair exonuclease SbcCD ATPase subunit
VKAAERADKAEAEVQRYRSFCGEALCGDVERDRDEYLRQNEELRAELERYRGLDAAAKELLARNVEFGTRADNAEAKCEDLEDEAERLRKQVGEEEVSWAVYAGHDAENGDMYHSTAEEYAREAAAKGIPVTKWVTRVYPTAACDMELDENGEWREVGEWHEIGADDA